MASGDIDVAYVAKLARIELTSQEIERFGAQLGDLLQHVRALEALPVADVAATAQVIPSTGMTREDVVRPSLSREVVLDGAPQRQGAYFRVPSILGDGS